jgi:hypothetical protein
LVLRELQPESLELALEMAALLPLEVAPPTLDAGQVARPAATRQARDKAERDKALASPPSGASALPHAERRPTPIALQQLPDRAPRRDALAGRRIEAIGEDSVRPALAFRPLLRPEWTRGILHAALATPATTGEVDVERLVRLAAAVQPVERLPLRRHDRLQQGVQVLVDAGEGMALFARDAQDVVRRVTAVAGRSSTHVLRFVGTPLLDCRPRSGLRTIAYEPPPVGTPVLVLTDLGIGRGASTSTEDFAPPASVAEWRAFVTRVADAGCPVTALVPYRASRIPPALREIVRILHWDERTSVRDVVRGRATAARAR